MYRVCDDHIVSMYGIVRVLNPSRSRGRKGVLWYDLLSSPDSFPDDTSPKFGIV